MVDTPFTAFKYPVNTAIGASALRSMGERLGEVANVLDFGATGTGAAHDDAPAINAAIQQCISAGGGKVEIPCSQTGQFYGVASPIICGHLTQTGGVQIIGGGKAATSILAISGYSDPNGYGILSKGADANNDCIERIEGLSFQSGIRLAGNNQSLFSISASSIDASGATGALLMGVSLSGGFRNGADAADPGIPLGSVGVAMGSLCAAQNVRFNAAFDVAFALAGIGGSVTACSAENHNNGIRFGWTRVHTGVLASSVGSGATTLPFTFMPPLMIAGRLLPVQTGMSGGATIVSADPIAKTIVITPATTETISSGATITFSQECPAVGFSSSGCQFERCNTIIDVYNAQGCFIGANLATQGDGVPTPYGDIVALSWSSTAGGTVTATTRNPHNLFNAKYDVDLGSGNHLLLINRASGLNGSWLPASSGGEAVCRLGSDGTHFTWTGVSSSPPAATPDGSGNLLQFNYAPNWGVRVRKATECFFQSSSGAANPRNATVDLDWQGQSVHRNNIMIAESARNGMRVPTVTKNLAGWKFIGCGGSNNPYGTSAKGSFDGNMIFADLPGQTAGNAQPGPFEGQEYFVKDSTLAATSANFGASVTSGGGSNQVKVRYNGSNWCISG